ncbi:ribonuclease III [Staphylococcus auricularis]|uniref:Ribonuclease 3 n=1 Tax=Staphylococcus auricularis TaxID=29379 RepID=A0AAP8PQK3_9STAP|nr:ribonuclease III [Staphylococcus auricularis]MBM0867690.1 ribonuclease III [Staphylococcus auricularis]MCG7340555.1 ribonuclease III [Staphylococcus auricularis]MDC6326508.1 ribonuclease III [Staphylococcus auricularis]MDN4532385.1 ribonuclease III [Staphylococcus auricularis]PNZ69057.1 ribonuclease III [Staphylococcus auricularis]
MSQHKKSEMVTQFRAQFAKKMEELSLQADDIELYQQAFSHSSFINDFNMNRLDHNERLEFLGDAVLELTVSRYLFDKYPNLPEGNLTKMRAAIVCEPSLVIFANKINLNELILLGKGEEKTGGRTRPSLVSDAFEAFVGALYLDQGLEAVQRFSEKVIFPFVEEDELEGVVDFKTQFQEFVHRQNSGEVSYRLVKQEGPAHHRLFTSEVMLDDQPVATGQGKTKKESEQKAAERAYKSMKQ